MNSKASAIAVVLLVALVGSSGALFAQTQTCPGGFTTQAKFIYSVKFVCGMQTFPTGLAATAVFQPPKEPPVKPGNYATSVNIHNYLPTDATVPFCKKAVVALTEADTHKQPGPVSPVIQEQLGPNQAMAVTCSDIVGLYPPGTTLPPLFIEGFVEIFSPLPLSVTAVYTSQSCIKPVPGKKCASLGELDTEVVPAIAMPVPTA